MSSAIAASTLRRSGGCQPPFSSALCEASRKLATRVVIPLPVEWISHMLGIELMPRIRNWKNIDLCRPDRKARYEHIDSLFGETINWALIETHFPDMLRAVLSIKAGRISASTILRRLGTYSRRNRPYQAFCQL